MTLFLKHTRCSSRQFFSLFSIAFPIFSQIFSDYIRRSPHFVRTKSLKRRRCLKKRGRFSLKRGSFSKKHGRFFHKRRDKQEILARNHNFVRGFVFTIAFPLRLFPNKTQKLRRTVLNSWTLSVKFSFAMMSPLCYRGVYLLYASALGRRTQTRGQLFC